MPAYAYPIKIVREPKVIDFTEEHGLNESLLTLARLREYVTDADKFVVDETGCLVVYKTRLETPKETRARVVKEEAYMAEYERRKCLRQVVVPKGAPDTDGSLAKIHGTTVKVLKRYPDGEIGVDSPELGQISVPEGWLAGGSLSGILEEK